MARGAEGKLRRRNEKKEARSTEAARLLEEKERLAQNDFDYNENELPTPPGMTAAKEEDDDDDNGDDSSCCSKERKTTKRTNKNRKIAANPPPSKPIKTLPLILLILLTGSTLLPGLIYAGDWIGNMVQKHHIMGSLGHRLGIGATPKKRVWSFYEKHDPLKLDDVPVILAKYYGNYPALVKKLERKYHDYGYFQQWEQDEAPLEFAKEKWEELSDTAGKMWMKHAPRIMKTGVRNAKHNLGFVYKKGRKIWRKKVWPLLEPFFGVPKGAQKQKRKDAREARARKGGKKNREFRDEDEDA